MHKIKSKNTCSCGSGKKYRKCCGIKKPRQEYIYATTAGEVSQISFSYDHQTGGFSFGMPMIKTFNQTCFARKENQKPKILNQIPLNDKELFFSSDETLIDEFDLLFAIDTNTKPVKSDIISISCMVLVQKVIDPEGGGQAIKWSTPFCMEFMNVNINAERLAWKILIDHIQSDEKLRAISRIGIIVDSDYSAIANYNERTAPIILDCYLPGNVQFVYATADGGTEYLANKLISGADKLSAKILNKLEAGEIPINKKIVQGKPYSSFRKIFSTLQDEKPPFQSLQK